MGSIILDKILITKNKVISVEGGDVMHGIKSNSPGFNNFGELYFSWIDYNYIKAWKKHNLMSLNLMVPLGIVKFIFYDENFKNFRTITTGYKNCERITVPPGIWFGFKGCFDKKSLVVNCADIHHDPSEVEKKSISDFPFREK